MSADGDTFDIDIYGDDAQEEQPVQPETEGVDDIFYGDDDGYDYGNDGSADAPDSANANNSSQPPPPSRQHQDGQSNHTSQQGTKRKAPSDEDNNHPKQQQQQQQSQPTPSPVDPNATVALKLTDLHWWTTEEDLRAFCAAAQVESNLVDFAFGEHKINGKSRGEAYLEFSSPAAASAVKTELEKKNPSAASNGEAKRLNPFHVYFTVAGNPFKGRDSGAVGKKDFNNTGAGRGGAYNTFHNNNNNNNNRGGFGGRGGGFNRGGGGFNRGGGYMNNNNNGMMNQQAWGAGNGGMGMGFAGNPMMAMGGYGNMARNNMGGMMNRANFVPGMNNMGNMMGMGGRGGGNMMMGGGRNGWGGGGMMGGGGMQQAYGGGGAFGGGMGMQQQGGQGQQQGPANKRMKAE